MKKIVMALVCLFIGSACFYAGAKMEARKYEQIIIEQDIDLAQNEYMRIVLNARGLDEKDRTFLLECLDNDSWYDADWRFSYIATDEDGYSMEVENATFRGLTYDLIWADQIDMQGASSALWREA